jgi:hypothetical protein
LFYSLFCAIFHLRWGLPGCDKNRLESEHWNYTRIRSALESVEFVLQSEDKRSLDESAAQFLEDSRLATTDAAVRVRRTNFILDRILA